MSDSFYICRIWLDRAVTATRFTYLSKGYGWCKRFEEARPFPTRDAARVWLHNRPGSIWPENELKASPYYKAEMAALNPNFMSHNTLQKIDPSESKSPVVITSTWEGVRHWLNAAKMFEQGKLFSQVMTGFELLALQKANNIKPGNPQLSQNGKIGDDWETILQKEAGLSRSTAYRYMDMAKAAAPRLKKLPALKNFDPFSQPMSLLGEPQRAAMETAVKKLTDGKTQSNFFDELYKQPSGNANPKDGGTRKTLTTAEQAAAAVKIALENSGWMGQAVTASNKDFFLTAADNDLEVDAQISVLEFALKLRTKYRNTPKAKREAVVAEILALIAQNDPLRHSELNR